MNYRKPGFRPMRFAWLAASLLLVMSTVLIFAANDTNEPTGVKRKWLRPLPAKSCYGSSYMHCHRASPVVVDITGDGKLEIVVATNNGHVLAFRHDGSVLWQTDLGPLFGMSSGIQEVTSSPAVADIDQDGRMEIVVGTGTTHPAVCTKGGVIVLDHNGRVEPGWPFITKDIAVPPSGCPDSVYSTPALGDLDKDGDLEIVFGSFDHTIYAMHHDGRMVSGFPPDSNHYPRFGWPELKGRTTDTIWSSPALADIDGDQFLDIVIGTDEGGFDRSHMPAEGNWTCPYRNPLKAGYCGGSIYALDRKGRSLEGFPRYEYEIIQSTPAIMDVDSDGRSEIFVGTGSWYYQQSPDHPTLGFRLYGMDSKGKDLPGWEGGKVVGAVVEASPSIGDITGDGKPNIVVAATDRRLYAWHLNGQLVSGFPMTTRDHYNQVLDGYGVGAGFILADYTGDGKMEIFLRHAWEVVIVNGKGQQLTAPNPNDPRPVYGTGGTIMNNPAVGDLDGDGHLELVVQNKELNVWDLPNSTVAAHWPMFKRNAARTSVLEPMAWAAPHEFNLLAGKGQDAKHRLQLTLSADFGTVNWRVSTNRQDRISFPETSGVVGGQKKIIVNVKVSGALPLGEINLGNVNVTFTQGTGYRKTKTIPIKVMMLQKLHQDYLPLVR